MTDRRPRHPHRSACGCFQKERETSEGTFCPSKRERSTWRCRHRWDFQWNSVTNFLGVCPLRTHGGASDTAGRQATSWFSGHPATPRWRRAQKAANQPTVISQECLEVVRRLRRESFHCDAAVSPLCKSVFSPAWSVSSIPSPGSRLCSRQLTQFPRTPHPRHSSRQTVRGTRDESRETPLARDLPVLSAAACRNRSVEGWWWGGKQGGPCSWPPVNPPLLVFSWVRERGVAHRWNELKKHHCRTRSGWEAERRRLQAATD